MGTGQDLQNAIKALTVLSVTKGYLSFDDVLDVTDRFDLPLDDVDRITDRLLTVGIIIRDNDKHTISLDDESEDDEYSDRSKLDYDLIFYEVINLDPSLKEYIEEVKTIPPPQLREVDTLIYQALAGNKYAYDRIIKMYLRTVVKTALSVSKKFFLPIADTIQDGNIGLINAYEGYDPNSDKRFSIHIGWSIRNAMVREAPTVNPTLYFPVHFKDLLFSIYDIVFDHYCESCLENCYCPELIKQVMSKLEIDKEKAIQCIAYITPFESVEELLEVNEQRFSDNGYFMDELVEDSDSATKGEQLLSTLTTLTSREQQVLSLRFGLEDGRERTLEEVGQEFNVTRERIRQIEAKAMRKLQHPSRSKKFKD